MTGPSITVVGVSTPDQHLAVLTARSSAERLLHVEHVPARSARLGEWPTSVAPAVLSALLAAGMARPWSHQRAAIDLAEAGRHVVLATGTASGKSLGYLAPVLSAASEGAATPGGRGATAIYLAPTKALAADQLARIESLAVPGVRAATYDGDTPPDERRWIRDHANVVLTNPDLLHHSLLPGPRALVEVPAVPPVRRRRRVPRLPRRVRVARRGGAAAAAAGRGALRRLADVRPRVGDRERPGHPCVTPHRDAGRGRHRGRLAPRRDDVRAVGAGDGGRPPALGDDRGRRDPRPARPRRSPGGGVRPQSRRGRGARDERPAAGRGGRPRPGESASRPTAGDTCRRTAACSSAGCATGRCAGWPRPTRSSSAST